MWGKWRIAIAVAMTLVTLLASIAVATRLRLDPNVASLLPERGEAAALRRYLRAFGGSDLGNIDQPDLFAPQASSKGSPLDQTMDEIRDRFGDVSVGRARSLDPDQIG